MLFIENLVITYYWFFFEVVSFACRFYYEGDLLNIVWLIPVIIFITRSSLTLFTSKQPNLLIQKNTIPNPNIPTSIPKYCKSYNKDIVKLIDSVPLEQYEGPPPFGINAPIHEYLYSRPQVNRIEPQITHNNYLYGNDPITSQQSSPLKSSPLKIRTMKEQEDPKDDLITRFRTLNLGNN